MICGLWLILLKEKIVELHKTMIPPTKPSVSIMSKQSKGNPRAILSAFFWPMRSSVSTTIVAFSLLPGDGKKTSFFVNIESCCKGLRFTLNYDAVICIAGFWTSSWERGSLSCIRRMGCMGAGISNACGSQGSKNFKKSEAVVASNSSMIHFWTF